MIFKDIVNIIDIIEEQSKERDQELLNRALKEIETKIRKEGWHFPKNIKVMRGNGRGGDVIGPAYTTIEGNEIVISPDVTDYNTIKRLIYHEAIHQCNLKHEGHDGEFKERCDILNKKYFKGREYIPIKAEEDEYQQEVRDKNYRYDRFVKQEKNFDEFINLVTKHLKEMGANMDQKSKIRSHLNDLFSDGAPLGIFEKSSKSNIDQKAKVWATEKLKKLRNGQPLGTYKR